MEDIRGDAILWERLQAGDTEALGALFDRHSDRIYRYCSRLTVSLEDAEDVLSEVFLEAWRSRRSFTIRGDSALPVLLAIAKRLIQKQHRSSFRRFMRERTHAQRESFGEDPAETVAAADELASQRAWLRTQVEALPLPYRNVYELCVYAELSPQEVSELLGIPLGTVKSRLSRARVAISDAARRTLGVVAERGAQS